MAQQQQTVLRVQTNRELSTITVPDAVLSVSGSTTMTISGSGTTINPYVGTDTTGSVAYFEVTGNNGIVYYQITGMGDAALYNSASIYIIRNGEQYLVRRSTKKIQVISGQINVEPGDIIYINNNNVDSSSGFNFLYIVTDETPNNLFEYEVLDLYGDVPIKINKSFAELQDISKRNSDFSIGLTLPGSKKNNSFFENFFNVDVNTLYFNPLQRIPTTVLINDEIYFDGYLKLNKISVLNSKVEYDVTLFSNIADLFGKIGNNLLKDLPFDDPFFGFNHNFSMFAIRESWDEVGFNYLERPKPYMYPITHNGYSYSGDTVNLSGATPNIQTRLFTTSSPIGSWSTQGAMYAAGVQPYRINVTGSGIYDNQLKPSMNIWTLIQLMFKNYGYSIKSDFMNTPWMKGLYMYGYFNSDNTKLSYKTPAPQILPLSGVEVIILENEETSQLTCLGDEYTQTTSTYSIYVVKKGTGTPALCSQEIVVGLDFETFPCFGVPFFDQAILTIPPNTTGTTYSWLKNTYVDCGQGSCEPEYKNGLGYNASVSNVTVSLSPLSYFPTQANTDVVIEDNDYINFNLLIDQNIKQIDILSSIAKKFNLVFVPDPQVKNQIIIEPYQYYVGTGSIYDWTDKLSFDKGFTVEPAQNFIESELIFSDMEDGDDGNKYFKDRNNKIYGQNYVYNETDFKSQTKKIETIFSPQVTRKWDNNVKIPLGINYVSTNSTQTVGDTEKVKWEYKGVKTKPKLFYYLGNKNIFFGGVGESYDSVFSFTTYLFNMADSSGISYNGLNEAPVISNTMPLGNPDNNKINNDSICILFNSEQPTDVGVETFDGVNAYTEQDMYNLFYQSRIDNLYNPNTRFLSGYFNLHLGDIKNLSPRDIIKIKEQYFTWNKIDQFNMVNPELTKVELVQIDNNPTKYPTRYFQYYYCADTPTIYKIKTDFTNPQMNLTHYLVSNWYDYNVGLLDGIVSGITSSFKVDFGEYLPFTMYEVDETTYNTSGDVYTDDPNINWDDVDSINYGLRTYWNTSTKIGINLWEDCAQFAATASGNGITVATPIGGTPVSPFKSGATINVTDTGWIKYTTPSGDVYKQITSTGVYTITDCCLCDSIRQGIPFADLASFTVINCGSTC